MKESTREWPSEGKRDRREKFSRRQKNVLNNLQAGVENGTCAFERTNASMQPSAACTRVYALPFTLLLLSTPVRVRIVRILPGRGVNTTIFLSKQWSARKKTFFFRGRNSDKEIWNDVNLQLFPTKEFQIQMNATALFLFYPPIEELITGYTR